MIGASLQGKGTDMAKFRKKPIVVEAEQFTWDGRVTCRGDMFLGYPILFDVEKQAPYIVIPTLEGDHRADVGDWIITGVKDERYPCKPDIFEQIYEAV